MAENQNNQLIEINEVDINDAKYFSNSFGNEEVRKKAFINSLGANVGFKFLASLGINAVNEKSLYTSKSILKKLEISDLNVGDIRIDTRLIFDENQIFISKKQFEYEVTPDFYLIFKVDNNLSNAEFLGFVSPNEINFENENRDYYFVEPTQLHNVIELQTIIDEGIIKPEIQLNNEELAQVQTLLMNFIDDDIINSDKKLVYKALLNNPQFFQQLIEFENFEVLSNELVNNEQIFKDSLLDNEDTQIFDDDEKNDELPLEDLAETTTEDFVEDFQTEPSEEAIEKEELPVPSLFEEDENEVTEPVQESLPPQDDEDDEIVLKPQLEDIPAENVRIDDLTPLNQENSFDLIDEDAKQNVGPEPQENKDEKQNVEPEPQKNKDENEFEIPNIELDEITFEDEPIIKEAPPEKEEPKEASEIKDLYNQAKPNDRPSEKIQDELSNSSFEDIEKPKKNKNPLGCILVILTLIILMALVYFAYKKRDLLIIKCPNPVDNVTSKISEYKEQIQDIELFNKDNELTKEDTKDIDKKIITKPASENFTGYKNPNQKIKQLEWEIPQELKNNAEVINYLQTVGKTLKISLQNDLLTIKDTDILENIILNIKFNENGTLKNVKIVTSSGLPKADGIVLQSVKAAVQYVKPTTAGLISSYYDLTLIIKF